MNNSQQDQAPRGVMGTLLHFRFLVLIVVAVWMAVGIARFRETPVDALPEFAPATVEIQTEALGLSPEEVERLITVPLEHNLLNGVAWLDKIRSESVAGLSSVTLIFEPGTDLYRARQMVAERLAHAAVTLPRVSRGPVMLQPKSATSRVLMVRLSSTKLSAIEMSVLARWTITPRLMGVPGVANVATWGLRDRQLQVQVDPDRLRAYQVSLLQLLESVGNALWVSSLSFVEAATPGNAGFIDTPQQRLGIQHVSPIVSAESLAKVNVQGTGALLINGGRGDADSFATPRQGGPVRLLDVADVVENHQPMIGDALAGDGANLLLVIDKFPGSDTEKVTRGVEEALAALRAGLPGVEVDSTAFRPATFLTSARENLARAGLIGAVILMVVIGLLFFHWRAALISLIIIPLSLVSAGLVLHWRDATMNVMVLTGLVVALGILVDDAILVVEAVLRRLRQRRDQTTVSIILETLAETRGVMLFATGICLLAVLPVFALPEITGNFFRPLAISYALAVLASMFVALIVTPVLAVILLPRHGGELREGLAAPLIRKLQTAYGNRLERRIASPQLAYGVIFLLLGLAVGSTSTWRPTLLPAFQERDLVIRLQTASGTSHTEMTRLVNRVRKELQATPGVRNVNALVGRAVFGDRIVDINSAEVWVNLVATADYDATVAAVQSVINGYPGVTGEVQTYLQQIGRGIMTEQGDPIVVRLYGQDWATLQAQAGELRQTLGGIDGVGELTIATPIEEPTLEVEVDLAAAQHHGINPGHIRRAASTLLNGIQVGSLFQEQKVFDVVVWSTPRTRGNLADIRNLLIDTPFDVPIRLGDVAQVRLVPRPSLIRHEDIARYIDIGVAVKGNNISAVLGRIQERLGRVQFPLEYHATAFRADGPLSAARYQLLGFVAFAVVGILLLLQAAYENWRLALLSCLTLPLALVGGLAALSVCDVRSAPLCALFGFLTVFGIAARNQLLLIRRIRQLDDGKLSPVEAILQGTSERFVPILMTVLTVGLVLVPVLFVGNIPGLELLHPIALVIIGGLVTTVLVELVVVPGLYRRVIGVSER